MFILRSYMNERRGEEDATSNRWREDHWLVITRLFSMWIGRLKFHYDNEYENDN